MVAHAHAPSLTKRSAAARCPPGPLSLRASQTHRELATDSSLARHAPSRHVAGQIHRELASGVSCAVGFKNGTGGNVQVAIDAISSASNPHSFLGVTDQGLAAIVHSTGNPFAHIILRGGSDGPNFEAPHIAACQEKIANPSAPKVSHSDNYHL